MYEQPVRFFSKTAHQIPPSVKQEIFDFHLMPGDRFTEGVVAARMRVSRTPVREALYRL